MSRAGLDPIKICWSIVASGGPKISLRWGAPTPKVDIKIYYLANFFPQICMKLKEFGPKGHIPGTPLDPLIVVHENYQPHLLFFTKTITIKQTK